MVTGRLATDRMVSRRRFLVGGAAAGVGLSSAGLLLAACGSDDKDAGAGGAGGRGGKVRWISPRGTLEVMDDFNLWVPSKMGYFKDLGLEVELAGGPTDATASTKFVAQNQADMGYPSPGILATSIDTGVEVMSVWQCVVAQTFGFAVPPDSPITKPQDLGGKRISVASSGWQAIVDPMLVEVGVDPKTVKYVETGQQWGQTVARKQVDAALSWEGLRAQWEAQGLKLRYLIGQTWSKHPANVYCARKADLQDAAKKDLYTRFLKGVVMGLEFTNANPRAAAQLTYRQFPALKSQMDPQVAVVSMMQNAAIYAASHKQGDGWGHHYEDAWQAYLQTIHQLGQTTKQLAVGDVLTNELSAAASQSADAERARNDAKAFKLDEEFAKTTVPPDLTM